MSKTLDDRLVAIIREDTYTPEEIQKDMLLFVNEWAKEHSVDVNEVSTFFYMASEYTLRLMCAKRRQAKSKSSTEPSGTCNC